MNIWDIIQNPIIIGLFAGVVVYIYMKNEKKDQKNKNINLLIPLVVFIAFVFISHVYFECYDSNEISPVVENKPIMPPMNEIYQSSLIESKNISETSDPASFSLVTNGIQIPNQLPNILFEMN